MSYMTIEQYRRLWKTLKEGLDLAESFHGEYGAVNDLDRQLIDTAQDAYYQLHTMLGPGMPVVMLSKETILPRLSRTDLEIAGGEVSDALLNEIFDACHDEWMEKWGNTLDEIVEKWSERNAPEVMELGWLLDGNAAHWFEMLRRADKVMAENGDRVSTVILYDPLELNYILTVVSTGAKRRMGPHEALLLHMPKG